LISAGGSALLREAEAAVGDAADLEEATIVRRELDAISVRFQDAE